MSDFAFADPAIVRTVYDPATGLANRNMLLQARFGPLRFLFGCRVGPITDETTTVEGRALRSWGWSYATLAGHLEMGKEDFVVWKWLDDGAVEFRIHVVSHRAREGNPVVRLGVRLFGRRQQKRFGRTACRRMAEMVEAELGDARGPGSMAPVSRRRSERRAQAVRPRGVRPRWPRAGDRVDPPGRSGAGFDPSRLEQPVPLEGPQGPVHGDRPRQRCRRSGRGGRRSAAGNASEPVTEVIAVPRLLPHHRQQLDPQALPGRRRTSPYHHGSSSSSARLRWS